MPIKMLSVIVSLRVDMSNGTRKPQGYSELVSYKVLHALLEMKTLSIVFGKKLHSRMDESKARVAREINLSLNEHLTDICDAALLLFAASRAQPLRGRN